MGFSIANTSPSAVITKIGTPSSVTGDLTITGGTLPLSEGGNISGSNTIISDQNGSPNGTIQMFLKQGDAKIDTFVNNTLYSSKKYSSGIAPVLTPVLGESDSLTMLVSDPAFDCYDIGTGFNQEPLRVAELPDGKLVMGGFFTTYKGVSANRIIRLNPDMSRDTTFDIGTGFNNNVFWVTTQSDDKILVGGAFTQYKGVSANRIIRLNTDGSRDTTFNIGTGFNLPVFAITIQPDGKLLVGGNFTAYSGTNYSRLIRLNTDGSIDDTFPNLSINQPIYEIGLQSDGKILPVGNFNQVSGTSQVGIVRLSSDGVIDPSFSSPISGASDGVFAILIDNDGKILIGGSFALVGGVSSSNIARLLTDGTRDTTFVVGGGFTDDPGSGFVAPVDMYLTNGKYLISGFFEVYNGTAVKFLVRLNEDGSIDTTLNQGTGFTTTAIPYDPIVFPMSDGNIIVGGLQGYDGEVIPKIAILTPFGGLLNCE